MTPAIYSVQQLPFVQAFPSYLSLILSFFYPSFVTLSVVHSSLRSTIITLQPTHYTDKQQTTGGIRLCIKTFPTYLTCSMHLTFLPIRLRIQASYILNK
jgi:hypothetical protein